MRLCLAPCPRAVGLAVIAAAGGLGTAPAMRISSSMIKELAAPANVEYRTMSDILEPTEVSWPAARQAIMKLPTPVRVRAPGRRGEIASTKDALGFIDRHLPSELARLPRWTFAHALLLEAERTGKSRDLKAAARQFRQALGNERWLEDSDNEAKTP